MNIGGVHSPRPENKQEFLGVLRGALTRAPAPLPKIPGVPLLGGLVGYTAYDAVRYFERIPGRSLDATRKRRMPTMSRRVRCWYSIT